MDGLLEITAAVSRTPGEPFRIESLTLEPPRAEEVLVRIVAAGMCHTDLAVRDAPHMPHPMILGHEGAGIVHAVGAEVKKLKPGDHVVLTFMFCGRCGDLRARRAQLLREDQAALLRRRARRRLSLRPRDGRAGARSFLRPILLRHLRLGERAEYHQGAIRRAS